MRSFGACRKRGIEREIEERLHDAVGDLYRRLGEAVERVSERLTEPAGVRAQKRLGSARLGSARLNCRARTDRVRVVPVAVDQPVAPAQDPERRRVGPQHPPAAVELHHADAVVVEQARQAGAQRTGRRQRLADQHGPADMRQHTLEQPEPGGLPVAAPRRHCPIVAIGGGDQGQAVITIMFPEDD